nr:HNH endonuclease [Paenibacillus xylanilyticus]
METGSAPFRQGMTEHEAQQTKTCMYCGQKRPLSEFRRRTGKRAGPGSRRGACRLCRQRGGQVNGHDISEQQNQSQPIRTQRLKTEPGGAVVTPASKVVTTEAVVTQDMKAKSLSSDTPEPSSGSRKKRRRRRKAKPQEAQPGLEQSEQITEARMERQAGRDPDVAVHTSPSVRANQTDAQATAAVNGDLLPEAPQDAAAGTADAGQQTAAGRKRKRRRKRSAPPTAGTGPDRITVKSDVPAVGDRGAAAAVDMPLAAAAQPAAPGLDPGQAAHAVAGTAGSAPKRPQGPQGAKTRPVRTERVHSADGEDTARATTSGHRPNSHHARSRSAGADGRPRRQTSAVPVPIDPEDPSSLRTNRQGMVRMRGKTDKGRRWHQEVDLELAVTLVKEKAAVVVNRYTIRRLFSNKDFKRYIMTRDRFTCYFCGSYGDTIDHLLPRAKGGHTTPLNCVCACNLCNQSKAAMDADEFMRSGIPEWNAAHQEELNEQEMQEAQLE